MAITYTTKYGVYLAMYVCPYKTMGRFQAQANGPIWMALCMCVGLGLGMV